MAQVLYRPMFPLTEEEVEVKELDTEECATCQILVAVNTYDDPFTSDFQDELPKMIRQFIIDKQSEYVRAFNDGFHGGMEQAKEEGSKA